MAVKFMYMLIKKLLHSKFPVSHGDVCNILQSVHRNNTVEHIWKLLTVGFKSSHYRKKRFL